MNILERFLNYVNIDTTSNPELEENPTSEGQIKLAEMLIKELKMLGLEVNYDDVHNYVYAVLKGEENLPKIGFISHLDTSPAAKGNDIKVNIINNYDGEDVLLANATINSKTYPDLKKHVGKTLITTDGSTLLGADDKAGIAEIMTMLEYFKNNNEEHGDIYVAFTPDEELGISTLHFNTTLFNPDYAYTVDGESVGEISYENFNAASAEIKISGLSTHTGYAKDKMINAIRIATIIQNMLPLEIPENTSEYDGFYHLESLSGNVESARLKYLIRDFDKENFENRKEIIRNIVKNLNEIYDNSIELTIKNTYKNMYDIMKDNMYVVNSLKKAILETGISYEIIPARGGTDGCELSFKGIPCPNIGTGGHNFHSVLEYTTLEDMIKSSEVLINLVKDTKDVKVKTMRL